MSAPAELYLRLQDDDAIAATSPARRFGALVLVLIMLAAVPAMWAAADALGIAAPTPALAQSGSDEEGGPGGDDDSSGPGSGGDDDDDAANTRGATATRSRDATNAGDTGVSTKPQTATRSQDATRTKNTGVSTRGSR